MGYSSLEEKFKDALYWDSRGNNKKFLIGALGVLLFACSSFVFWGSKSLFSNQNITSSVYGKLMENPKEETSAQRQEESLVPLSKDKNKRINILLIGIPGEPWPASYLTDSIQVISTNPDTQKIAVVAIPRDLLVKIPGSNYETRINSLYSLENNPSLLSKKIREITGINIHYYVAIDLKTLQNIINIVGGIDVNVKKPLYDSLFPTVSRGHETFSLSAGVHHLDGKTVIKYIRSRHQKRGDFGRIERQQQVIEALKKRIIELDILDDLPKVTALFKEFKGKTNFTLKELKTLISLAKKLSKGEIEYFVIDAGKPDSSLLYGQTLLGNKTASVLWPKTGKFNYTKIKERINNLLKD
mgnify:CR=1 FL=1